MSDVAATKQLIRLTIDLNRCLLLPAAPSLPSKLKKFFLVSPWQLISGFEYGLRDDRLGDRDWCLSNDDLLWQLLHCQLHAARSEHQSNLKIWRTWLVRMLILSELSCQYDISVTLCHLTSDNLQITFHHFVTSWHYPVTSKHQYSRKHIFTHYNAKKLFWWRNASK